jgi:hypothetical protein
VAPGGGDGSGGGVGVAGSGTVTTRSTGDESLPLDGSRAINVKRFSPRVTGTSTLHRPLASACVVRTMSPAGPITLMVEAGAAVPLKFALVASIGSVTTGEPSSPMAVACEKRTTWSPT